MSDFNTHAWDPGSVPPNCELGSVWTRDPLDSLPIGVVLNRLVRRRGLAHVMNAVLGWTAANEPLAICCTQFARREKESGDGPTNHER